MRWARENDSKAYIKMMEMEFKGGK